MLFDPKVNTIHFVYAYKFRYQLPYFTSFNKIIKKLLESPLLLDRKSFKHKMLYNPIPAPFSITYNIFNELSRQYKVLLYDAGERITINPKPGDILIGHLLDDTDTIMARSIDHPNFSKKIIVQPFTASSAIQFLESYVERLDKILFICGEHWNSGIHKYEKIAQAKHKITFMEMPVDTAYYPVVKTKFSPKGERKFFYVGRAGHDKGTDILNTLTSLIPGFKGYYVGDLQLEGWTQVAKYAALDDAFVRKNFLDFDFFINLSRIDAQATTIGEAMAWGFPVVCTPQSGYDNVANILNVDYLKPETVINAYNYLQSAEEDQLLKIAGNNRKYVENNLNWTVFTDKVHKSIIE